MSDKTQGTNRRNFLKLAGTAAPAAIAVAAGGATTAAAQPVDLSSDKDEPHCIEITEIHGDASYVLAAATGATQVLWLETMLNIKTKTQGMGRLNVVKANAALKHIKRKLKMPSM